jgi:hypothetical protein
MKVNVTYVILMFYNLQRLYSLSHEKWCFSRRENFTEGPGLRKFFYLRNVSGLQNVFLSENFANI